MSFLITAVKSLQELHMSLIKSQVLEAVAYLRTSHFLGNVTKLASGEVCAQTVGFCSIPTLTRLYIPEAFGLMGLFIAITEVGGRISTLRYDVALVLPKEDRDAWSLLRFSAGGCLLFSVVLLAVAYPFRRDISLAFGSDLLAQYFPLVALMILVMGWQSLTMFWSLRQKHFKSIAKSAAGSSVLGHGLKILGGVIGFGAGGLLIGSVAQRLFNFLILRFLATPREIWKLESKKGEGLRQAAVHREFPMYRMPQDTLNSLTRQLPNILLVSFFSPVAAGFYILATRVLELPFSIFQDVVRKVFYVQAVDADRAGESLFRLCSLMSILIAVVMAPLVLIVFMWGSFLFELVFGTGWATTGSYAKWVMLASLFSFCSVPASVVIPVVGMNKFYLIFEAISMVFRVSVLVFAAMSWTVDVTVAAIAICSSVSSSFLIGIVLSRLWRMNLLRAQSV